MFLFSNNNVTHMNVSKQYKENRGVRAFLTSKRKHQINLLPSSNFLSKIVPYTGTVPFTYFMGYSESILWIIIILTSLPLSLNAVIDLPIFFL